MLYFYIGLSLLFLITAFFLYNYITNRIARYQKKLQYLIQIKDYIGAVEVAKKLIATQPRHPDYHMQLADIYMKAKMIPSAIDAYKNILTNKIFSLTIRDYNIRERLALITLEQGKTTDAFQELYRIYKANINSPLALALLGKIYGSQKKFLKAEELIRKAISIKPKEGEYHYLLGILFLDVGNLDNAYAELERAYQLDSTYIKAQYFLALACRQKGLEEKARILLGRLNITSMEDLPDNITQIGIMAQGLPRFEIDQVQEQIDQEFLAEQGSKANDNIAKNVNEIIRAGPEIFTSTAYYVIDRMGYLIQKDIKIRFFDPANEIDVLAIAKKEKDNPEARRYYIQFTRAKTELGLIPFHDFIEKVNESGVRNGILVITTTFNPKILEEVAKLKRNIVLIDATKLSRYLPQI